MAWEVLEEDVGYLRVSAHLPDHSRLEKRRGRTHFIVTRFLQDDDLVVLAATRLRAVAIDRRLGDA